MSQQGGTEVLEELGGGWLKCVDAQGVFYHNSQTKENSETPPPQFAGQAQQPDSATLKSTLGDFQVCEDAQGEFYVHTPSGQTFDQPPPQLQQLLQAQKPAVSHALSAPPVQYAAAPQAAAPVQPAKVKMTLGEWQICEDSQGEYYVHTPSGQTFEQPPPQLLQLYQAKQGQHVQSAPPVQHAASPGVQYAAAPQHYAARQQCAAVPYPAAPQHYGTPQMCAASPQHHTAAPQYAAAPQHYAAVPQHYAATQQYAASPGMYAAAPQHYATAQYAQPTVSSYAPAANIYQHR